MVSQTLQPQPEGVSIMLFKAYCNSITFYDWQALIAYRKFYFNLFGFRPEFKCVPHENDL
jgi:hypothetical protein